MSSESEKEILRIYFQGAKANAELALEMLERGAPSQQPVEKQREEKQSEKDYFKAGCLLWVNVSAPLNPKGDWEKTDQTDRAEFREIELALKAAGKPLFSQNPPALYWLLEKDGKVTGIGRRKAKVK